MVFGKIRDAWSHPVAQNVRGRAKNILSGAGTFGAGVLVGAVGGTRNKVEGLDLASKKTLGNAFAFFAIILWIVDILPGLGGVYSGFNFDPQYFWSNWFSDFTFGNVWFDTALIILIIYFAVKYLREGLPSARDIFSFVFFLIAIIFFIANPGWVAFPKAVIHFIFIILFGLFYARQTNDLNMAFISIAGLLFFDFFFFSTILKFVPFLKYISLLSAIIIIWIFAQTPSGFTASVFIVLMIFIIVISVAEGLPVKGFYFQESDTQKSPISELGDRIKKGIGNYQKQISSSLEAKIQYAITGKVEENKYEPLGVYLENIQSAEDSYYEDEDVIVWGTIKAKTLDDEIKIKVGCYVKKDKKKIYAQDKVGRTDPPGTFSVFTLEEQDFACTFYKCCETNDKPDECKIKRSNCKLKEGSNTITTFADFNFGTLAYLKTYFIDNDRKRAMTREELDIFDEFGIKDKNPVAVYTNGPVEIGMETTALIGVGNDIVNPYLSITLQNREGWEGEITKLNELTVFFPVGADLDNKDPKNPPCNKNFEEYKLDKCKASCNENIKNCPECAKKCEDTCFSLFEGGYNAYTLKLDDPDVQRDLKEGFEKFKFFRCRFKPNALVLGNTPITTKFFRVKAEYDYTVEKPVIVNIKKVPELGGTTTTAVPDFLGYDTLGRKVYSNDFIGPLEQGAVRQSEAKGTITPTPPTTAPGSTGTVPTTPAEPPKICSPGWKCYVDTGDWSEYRYYERSDCSKTDWQFCSGGCSDGNCI